MFPEFSAFVCRVNLVTEPTENVCGSGQGNWPKGSKKPPAPGETEQKFCWELPCG